MSDVRREGEDLPHGDLSGLTKMCLYVCELEKLWSSKRVIEERVKGSGFGTTDDGLMYLGVDR